MKKWLVSWEYQEKRKKTKTSYEDGPKDFSRFTDTSELLSWFKWFQEAYPDYLGDDLVAPLVNESLETDKKVLSSLGLDFDFSGYSKNIGLNNAHDFLLPQLYPVPARYKIERVLDFGAGHGRQANLWTAKGNKVYVAMDAVPKSYCLQYTYFKALGRPFTDYVNNPAAFQLHNASPGIYHLPTWRYDLLPSDWFSLVSCVQVLPELNSKLIKKMLEQFYRVLKPGGMLYIRDHGQMWRPAGKINVDEHARSLGFVPEFTPHVIDNTDIHGVPRIYRKPDPQVISSQTVTISQRLKEAINDADYYSGGLLKKIAKRKK